MRGGSTIWKGTEVLKDGRRHRPQVKKGYVIEARFGRSA